MSNKAKTYTKYAVKRKAGTKKIEINQDGSPVLGDVIKTNVRLSPSKVDILNFGWDNEELPITFYYKEQETQKEVKQEEQPEEEVKKAGRPSTKKGE